MTEVFTQKAIIHYKLPRSYRGIRNSKKLPRFTWKMLYAQLCVRNEVLSLKSLPKKKNKMEFSTRRAQVENKVFRRKRNGRKDKDKKPFKHCKQEQREFG